MWGIIVCLTLYHSKQNMNKRFFLVLFGFLSALTLTAQEMRDVMVVRMFDGTTQKFVVEEIDYVDFTQEAVPEEPDPYEAVDLGLSVKWATMNVGAQAPEDYGDLFSWGETNAKEDYSEDAYTYYVNWNYLPIGNDICGTDYDAAHIQWRHQWRMPSKSDVEELTSRCTWTSETLNGVNGYRVTGPNNNSIFLPLAGYKAGTTLKKAGVQGYYWTGTLNTGTPSSAYTLNTSGYDELWSASRAYGFSIRAVKD